MTQIIINDELQDDVLMYSNSQSFTLAVVIGSHPPFFCLLLLKLDWQRDTNRPSSDIASWKLVQINNCTI